MQLGANGRFLLPIFLVTLCLVYLAAALGGHMSSVTAATSFSIAAIIVGFRSNRRYWPNAKDGPPAVAPASSALAETTRLIAAVYAWGALALLTIYPLIGLHWQHGWQYGSAMLVVAVFLARYAALLERGSHPLAGAAAVDRAAILTALHGIAVAIALAWMVMDGKIQTSRFDWAANHVFLAGGFAVMCLCMFATKTHWTLMHPRD